LELEKKRDQTSVAPIGQRKARPLGLFRNRAGAPETVKRNGIRGNERTGGL